MNIFSEACTPFNINSSISRICDGDEMVRKKIQINPWNVSEIMEIRGSFYSI